MFEEGKEELKESETEELRFTIDQSGAFRKNRPIIPDPEDGLSAEENLVATEARPGENSSTPGHGTPVLAAGLDLPANGDHTMSSHSPRLVALTLAILASVPGTRAADSPAVTVDKKNRTVTIPAVVAPRKVLERIYPIEVIATFPAPKGQKAHETVVNFQVKPSDVHKAIVSLGIKPGKPVVGEGAKASGPEVEVFLEVPRSGGKVKRIPIEETMVDSKSGKPMPRLRWYFTGSAMKQPDPEKDDTVYGADLTGTLITIFPVTNDTVLQSNLSFKQQENLRLETNKQTLPKEGTPVKLVIKVK
jgi:hypothetical protein